MSRLTDDQKKVINTRYKNIIVSAAAGSGKTMVLVERIIDLVVNEKNNIDSMIIVTFTNKASAEMKTRIQRNLEQIYNESSEDRDFLKDQLRRLRNTHIQTLHSFCADMLREYFNFADDLSPNFRIMDDKRAQILRTDSIDELFDERYLHLTDSFSTFINNFSKSRNDHNAKEVVKFAYNKVMDQVDVDLAIERYFTANLAIDEYKMAIIREINNILERLNALTIHPYLSIASPKLQNFIQEDFDEYSELVESILAEDKSWDLIVNELINFSFRSITKGKENKIDKGPEYTAFKEARDEIVKAYNALVGPVGLTHSEIYNNFAEKEEVILTELKSLVLDFKDIYSAKKIEASALDFNDLEHEFVKMLENEDALNSIKDQYDFIFFDEYQDANDVQNYIVEKLSKENNLFFVGDVKQSIYGFRRANPELFLERLKVYGDQANKSSIRIDLNQNFRTEKDILEFNNYIFDRLMTEENSGIDYKNGGHRLNHAKDADKALHKVELDIVEKNNDPYKAVANRVLSLLDETYTYEETVGEETRLCQEKYDYKDIIILLRSGRTKASKFENALKEAGIPVKNEIDNPDAESVEVNFFIDMLKFIVNPYDDITLLSVLRSEIFDFSEDDISKIRLFSSYWHFNEAFYDYQNGEDNEELAKRGEKAQFFDQAISNKINDFLTIFRQIRYELSIRELFDFGNYLFENTGYYDFLIARDRAEERVGKVLDLIDLMDDYDKSNDNGLYGFLKYYDDLSTNNNNDLPARALTDNENFVRIMTVHKSKGLESKAVILANANREMRNQDAQKAYVFDQDLGFGFRLVDEDLRVSIKSINFNVIADKIHRDDLREEMRILYVALTRAENKLIISQEVDNLEELLADLATTDDYLSLKSHTHWILKALMEDNHSNIIPTSLTDIVKINIVKDAETGQVNYYPIDDLLTLLNEGYYYQEFVDNFSPYEYEIDTTDPIKKSVTELAKNFVTNDDEYEDRPIREYVGEFTFKTPKFLEVEETFTPMEKGTLIHKIFQNIPVKSYTEEELRSQLQKLVELYKVTDEELKLVEIDKFLNFYNSELVSSLVANANAIINEESFLMKHIFTDNPNSYYYINGQIDLMFDMGDEIVLLDFKTDMKKRPEAYENQLKYYKLAIEEAMGKKVNKSLIYWYNFNEFSQY